MDPPDRSGGLAIDALTCDDHLTATPLQRRRQAARRWSLLTAAASAVVVVDQTSKWWARNVLESPMHVVGSLRFNLAFNSGTAFSRFQGWGQVIAVVAIAVVVVLLRASRAITSRWGAVAMGLVVGGAVGNLVDRVSQAGPGVLGGKVTDFIDLQWWPVFNVADAAITIGGIIVVLGGLRSEGSEPVPGAGASPSAAGAPAAKEGGPREGPAA